MTGDEGSTVYRYCAEADGVPFYVGFGKLARPPHSVGASGHNQCLNDRVQELGPSGFFIEYICGEKGGGISQNAAYAIEQTLINLDGGGRSPKEPRLCNANDGSENYRFTRYIDLRLGLDPIPLKDGAGNDQFHDGRPWVSYQQVRSRAGLHPADPVGVVVVSPGKLARIESRHELAVGGYVPPEWRAEWCLRFWKTGKSAWKHLLAVYPKPWGSTIVGSYAISVTGNRCLLPAGAFEWREPQDGHPHPLVDVGATWTASWNVGGLCGFSLPPARLKNGKFAWSQGQNEVTAMNDTAWGAALEDFEQRQSAG